MIDARVSIAPARDILVLDLWEGQPPALAGVRILPVERRRWWLLGATAAAADLVAAIGERGALAPIGGGMMRATLTGPGWRALLSVSGVFDSAQASFPPGAVAATILHHVPVWIAVTPDDACEVYVAASYTPSLTALWFDAIGEMPAEATIAT